MVGIVLNIKTTITRMNNLLVKNHCHYHYSRSPGELCILEILSLSPGGLIKNQEFRHMKIANENWRPAVRFEYGRTVGQPSKCLLKSLETVVLSFKAKLCCSFSFLNVKTRNIAASWDRHGDSVLKDDTVKLKFNLELSRGCWVWPAETSFYCFIIYFIFITFTSANQMKYVPEFQFRFHYVEYAIYILFHINYIFFLFQVSFFFHLIYSSNL